MLKRIALIAGIFLLATNLSAGEMYMWVDSEGVKHFSDRPPQRAEKAQVRGEVTTDVLRVDRRPPKPPVSTKSISESIEKGSSAPTQANSESEAETQNTTNPASEGQ